jgi:hypothetical protein
VKDRVGAGKEGGVRRQRQRRRRDATVEHDALIGEPIDEVGSDIRVSVGSKAVCANRVESDHEHVEVAIAHRHELLPIARSRGDHCDDSEPQAEELS